MRFEFKKKLAPQKGVRLNKGDAEVVERIATKEGITQDEIIRTFVHEAVKEYLGQENTTPNH